MPWTPLTLQDANRERRGNGTDSCKWLEAVCATLIKSAERRAPSAEYCLGTTRPPSPPDRRPPRRGGGSSPYTYAVSAAGRSAGPARLRVARRGLLRAARALAAAALLALTSALALPAAAQDPPTLSSAEVRSTGERITLDFSENLNLQAEALPTAAGNAFTVNVDGVERQFHNITWGGQGLGRDKVLINFATKIYQGQTVVVSYDQSAAGNDAIADSDGDEVASFTTGEDGVPAVVNNSTQTPPVATPTNFRAMAGDGEVTLSWDEPGSDSGVTHHDYRFRTDGSYGDWIEIDDSGPGETNASGFTVTADIVNGTAYTFQLRAGGADDSPAVTSEEVTPTGLPPRVTSVVVASAPQSGDTYRSYETIVFTVTFSEPVRVTPGRLRLKVGLDNPGGASGSTVEAVFSGLSQSQRPTADTPQAQVARHLHFEYKVQLFDRDVDGVRIGANALRLASGAWIRSEGGGDAELDHAALGTQSDHKVDGTADVPMIERIEVVSTPRLSSKGTTTRDTYGEGENIRIEVRFDQPVVVEGEPTFALEVGNPCLAVCEAYYESGSGTNTLVFAYLVLEVDIDRNGIAIRGNPIEVVSGDSIRNAADQEAHLSSRGKGTQRGHKVDGSRAAASHLSVEDAEAHEADGEMEFTVAPGAARPGHRDGRLRDGRRHGEQSGEGGLGLHGDERHADVQFAGDGADGVGADHGRRPRGRRRDVHADAVEPGRREAQVRRRGGHGHDPQQRIPAADGDVRGRAVGARREHVHVPYGVQ